MAKKKPVKDTASRKAKSASKKNARAAGAAKKKGGTAAHGCNTLKETSQAGLIPAELQVTPDKEKAKVLPQEIRSSYESIARIYKEAVSLARDARAQVLKKCYELGQEVKKLLTPAAEAGDDTETLERLAGALGVNPRSLRDAGNVAATIPVKEFESLCSHAEICWSHLKILAIADKPTRSKLARQIIQKGSSVRDLSNAIRDNSPNAKKRGPGKSRGVPGSPQTALRQMRKEFEKLDKSFGDIYFGKRFNVAKEIGNLKREEISDGLRGEVSSALASAQAFQAKLPAIIAELDKVMNRINASKNKDVGSVTPHVGKRSRRRSSKGVNV